MDPNKTLEELRATMMRAAHLFNTVGPDAPQADRRHADGATWKDGDDLDTVDAEAFRDALRAMYDGFDALDGGWLARGGFVPAAWAL